MLTTVALNTSKDIASADYALQRVSGVWAAMGSGMQQSVYAIAIAPDGKVYMGGAFTDADGVANTAKIAMWDGLAWNPLGVGLNGEVAAIAIAANGDVYVGGNFTDVVGGGGGTYNKIAMWDGAAWNAVGAGLNDYVRAIVLDSAGDVYIGGDFTDVLGGGGGTYPAIIKWDGLAYSGLGTGLAPAANVHDMAMALNGSDVYVTGAFFTGNGVTLNRIGMWNGTTFKSMGGGLDDFCYALVVGLDGRLYAGGRATTFGALSTNYLAMWSGATWLPLGGSVNQFVYGLGVDKDSGHIWVAGDFTEAGTVAVADRLAIWNGTNFLPLDVDLPGAASVFAIESDGHRVFIGYNTAGTATTSGVSTTTITHAGATRAYPTFAITRSGGTTATLESIQNLTTGKKLFFDHALLDGQKVTIDLRPGFQSISPRSAFASLLPGSDFAAFNLVPGENEIVVYISEVGAPTVTAFIQWETEYETIDEAAL